jgi:ubiquinone/menaquinone biosynthesis C-methylase UbiE
MRWFRASPPGDPLAVTMTGVKLGDRLLIVGGGQTKLVAQLALKPGLTGRGCTVDESASTTARAAEAALKEGALMESETAPLTALPYPSDSFDVVVMNHTLRELSPEKRVSVLGETRRVLRDGGRCIAVEKRGRAVEIEDAFRSAGYRAVRTLAEREGLAFVEGAKRN